MTPLQIMMINFTLWFILIACLPRSEEFGIKILAFGLTTHTFMMSLDLLYFFDPNLVGYQFGFEMPIMEEYGLYFSFGVEAVGLCFLLLTTFIMPICVYAAAPIVKDYKQFIVYLLFIEFCLILCFTATNILMFFVFFETVLIPMYFLIGEWGTRERRINAAYYIFLYTIFGSFFLLFGILYLYNEIGSLDNQVILHTVLSKEQQIFLFVFFFLPFAIKIPMYPFHIWLPEAHVEAPTIGSVILASLLLKLGGFGFIRYTIAIVPAGCDHFSYIIYGLATISIIYASVATLRQNDLKRIIAYSSIAHMNLAVIGIFSMTPQGLDGAIYLMLSHGFVSAGLFFCVGILYDRYHTRSLRNYSGLALVMPVFCMFFFFFTCGNMGFPITASFIGEFLIFIGMFEKNNFLMVLTALSIFLSASYSIWCYNRIANGTLKIETETILEYAEINRHEYMILFALVTGMLAFGIYSPGLTDLTHTSIADILKGVSSKR